MSYKIAICDDNPSHVQHIQGLTAQWADRTGQGVKTRLFPSAEAFLFAFEAERDFDLLLLDVEMGGMDGVTMARRVREVDERVQIVFISGYADYISEGYEVSALHYLTKPLNQEKFFAVLDRAAGRMRRSGPQLTLELAGETARVPLEQIRYLEVFHNYVTVHAGRDYTVKRSLSELEAKLDGRFFRIGRSCILNLSYVRRASRQSVELTSGEIIPLPRGQYEKLNRAIISEM